MKTFRSLILLGLSTATAHAQCFVDPLGSPQLAGDESSSTVDLGFPFTMPDGTPTTEVLITSNGRILPPGGDAIDFSESVPELLGSTMLCPLWSDQNFGAVTADDIYFATNNVDRAVIQFNRSVEFQGVETFSYSVILNGDSSWEIQYGNTLPMEFSALVGFSDGSGIDPGESDFSLAIDAPLSLGSSAYEQFSAEPIDVAGVEGASLLLIPNGSGYDLSISSCLLGAPDPLADVVDLGNACNYAGPLGSPVSVTWTPDGNGGYDVTFDTGVALDTTNLGESVAPTDDSISTATLGFPFTMPGGVVVEELDIDSNGRVVVSGSDSSDFSPTVPELLFSIGASICPFWVDLNTTLGGDVTFFTDPATSRANITWDASQFGTDGSEPLQFQLQLDGATNSWTVVYQTIGNYSPNASTFGNNAVIGCSPGLGSADPGETDISAGVATGGDPSQYEFIESMTEDQDLQSGGGSSVITLTSNLPRVPGTWDLAVEGLPESATLGVYAVGFTNPNAPLSMLDPTNPCFLLTSNDIIAMPLTVGGTSDTAPQLPVSCAPLGTVLYAQALVVDPTALMTAIPVITSNGLEGTAGI